LLNVILIIRFTNYCYGDQIKGMGWTRHTARIEGNINAYKTLMRKPEGKKPLGKPKCRWD